MSETTLHHDLSGAGRPAVVMIHGLCCAGEDWVAQVAALGSSHETMTVDLRGHGRSTGFSEGLDIVTAAADVAALARQHALSPAVVVGHSMGCRVAVETARIAPNLVRGLVLVDGSALAHKGESAPPHVDFSTTRDGLFDAMFVESSDPAVKRAIVARAAAMPVAVGQSFHNAMVAYDATRMRSALAELEVPIAAVQSTYMNPELRRVSIEPGMRVPWLELIEETAHDGRIELVPGVGHFTMIEAPDAVDAAIAAIAARVTAHR